MAGDPGTINDVLEGATSGYVGLREEIAKLAEQLGQLQAASESARAKTSASGSSGSSPVASTLLNVFGAGLGLSPLISGIASLLGGGGSNPAPDPLIKFTLPPSIHVNAGVSESGGAVFAVDHPQGGLPRAVPVSGPAQITVQVQAMDSKSFLDHSADIAMAVRQAMLESSVLNDVVREA